MKRVLQSAGTAVAAAAVMLTGCSPTDATREQTTATSPAAPAAVDNDSNERLETNARARFQRDDSLRAYDVDVSAQNGRVTLRGTVPSEQAKQQAVAAVKEIDGVQSVEDQLTVAAGGQQMAAGQADQAAAADRTGTPGWITTKIQAQYFVSPEIRPWNIDVTTNRGGVVTLRGAVEEARDKEEAVRIARSTEGVTQVDDRLTVRGDRTSAASGAAAGANEPDPWITAKIQAKYFLDDEVKGHDIDVDTSNGTVTLRGTVENEQQKRQALALARNTEGVRDVTDQLTVAAAGGAAGSGAATRPASARVDDAWITTKIQSQFFLDRDIKGSDINVNTSGGVVTLQGSVRSREQGDAAERIARETEGVTRVENQLKVTTTSM
jgi:osmotically-inducible protein OsmY